MKAKRILFGALVGGVVTLAALFTACAIPSSPDPEEAIPQGMGRLTVTFDVEGFPATDRAARTVTPAWPSVTFTKYVLSFAKTTAGADHDPVSVTSGTNATVNDLVPGTYTVTVTAHTGTGTTTEVAVGSAAGVAITAGTTATASVTLGPKTGGADGTFGYDITVPSGLDSAQLVVTTMTGGTVTGGTKILSQGQNTGTISLSPGYYYVKVELKIGSKSAGFRNEAIHIYTGLTSALPARTYTAADFAENTMVTDFNLIGLFPAPSMGGTPAAGFTGDQYTGTIAWKTGGSAFTGSAFAAGTAYTAEVHLTAAAGYTFTGVTANAFSHGGITGTNAANSGEVTITFPATGTPTTGSVDIGISPDNGSVAVTGDNGTNTIVKDGDPDMLTLSVTGFTVVRWNVDNGPDLPAVNPLVLDAADYDAGEHTVSFSGVKGGVPYSTTITFTVEASGGSGPVTVGPVNAAGLAAALAQLTTDGSAEAPHTVILSGVDVNTNSWSGIYYVLQGNTKYITLDLSACTATGNKISGGNPPSNYNFNVMRSSDYIMGIILPSSLETIESFSFYEWTGLRNVTLGDSIVSIGNSAFHSCSNLLSITIPNNITTIASGTFRSCAALTSVTIPASVTSIGTNAFRDTGLTSVTFDGSSAVIGNTNSFPNDLKTFYDQQSTKAGTYIWNGTAWTKQP
jgi:hypothetical protein